VKGLFVSAAGGAAAYGLSLVPALVGWPFWVLSLAGLPVLFVVYLRHRTTRYRITRRRIEFERGILSKRVDSLELWRVLDVSYSQTLLDRILGNATLVLMGTDRSSPALSIHGLPEARKVFESLRDAVQDARQLNRPYEFQTNEAGH